MNGYKVYLTKSNEVAELIARAYRNTNNIDGVGYGSAERWAEIPEIYKGKKYFACVVRFKNQDKEFFELVIA